MMKDILTKDYGVQEKKIHMIRTIIPKHTLSKQKKGMYFLYFGYIVRRKGLEKLIHGFAKFHKKHPDFKLVLAGGTIRGQEKAKDEIRNSHQGDSYPKNQADQANHKGRN